MSRRPRRNHSPDSKAKAALAAIEGDRAIAQMFAVANLALAMAAVGWNSLQTKPSDLAHCFRLATTRLRYCSSSFWCRAMQTGMARGWRWDNSCINLDRLG